MDYKHISELLEKYWTGESSLSEEAQLRQYFEQGPVAPEHRQFAPLFQLFGQQQEKEQLSADFDEKLLAELESEPPEAKIRTLASRRKLGFYLSRIAAVVTLALGLWWFTESPLPSQEVAQLNNEEVEEARETYRQAKAALLLLSTKMNKGTATAARGLNELDKSTQIIK